MRLLEYQAKRQLKAYNIPIPKHVLVTSYTGARQAIDELMGDVLLKPQGPRHAPAIRFAQGESVSRILNTILTSDMTIRSILVEKVIPVQYRVYLSLQADRRTGKLVLQARMHTHDEVYEDQKLINPFIGLREYQARDLASNLNLARIHWQPLIHILQSLFHCYIESDAEHIALNPLGITHNNQFIVLNAQMHIDDDALQRQPDFYMLQSADITSSSAARAQQVNITYIKLEGNISCISGGSGLGLTTLDSLYQQGDDKLRPGQLIDIGNMIHNEKIDVALKTALADPDIELVLVNLFESDSGEDSIAHKIITSYEGIPPAKPIIIRLNGVNAEDGLSAIKNANIENVYTKNDLSSALETARELLNREHIH